MPVSVRCGCSIGTRFNTVETAPLLSPPHYPRLLSSALKSHAFPIFRSFLPHPSLFFSFSFKLFCFLHISRPNMMFWFILSALWFTLYARHATADQPLSPCFLNCTNIALSVACSGISDLSCLCNDNSFQTVLNSCIIQQCPDEHEASIHFREQECAGYASASHSSSMPPSIDTSPTPHIAQVSSSQPASFFASTYSPNSSLPYPSEFYAGLATDPSSPLSSMSPSARIAIIIGAVMGVILIASLGIFLCWWFTEGRKEKKVHDLERASSTTSERIGTYRGEDAVARPWIPTPEPFRQANIGTSQLNPGSPPRAQRPETSRRARTLPPVISSDIVREEAFRSCSKPPLMPSDLPVPSAPAPTHSFYSNIYGSYTDSHIPSQVFHSNGFFVDRQDVEGNEYLALDVPHGPPPRYRSLKSKSYGGAGDDPPVSRRVGQLRGRVDGRGRPITFPRTGSM